MITELKSCTRCGKPLRDSVAGLQTVCPSCLLRAVQTPRTADRPEATGSSSTNTTWADVFPQFRIERTLRASSERPVYLAVVEDEEPVRRAIVQIVTGEVLLTAGGVPALMDYARSLVAGPVDGLLPILDFGDLCDSFYLATEAPDLPLLADELGRADAGASAVVLEIFDRESRRLGSAGEESGLEVHLDPSLAFVTPDRGSLRFTPSALPLGAAFAGRNGESEQVTELVAGARITSFELEEKLGEGGFGEVWRARQLFPVDRQVALKVLKDELHSSRARARFDLEQAALARLDHTHIARLFEAGFTPDGRPFFAMEWVDGETLGRYAPKAATPLSQQLAVFTQVCQAVQHAHQKGILHRDLKPSNIMVAEEDDVPVAKVIDFGVARAVEEPAADQSLLLTRPHDLMGTPVYMSPEQLDNTTEADARADVYSLGVTLYELLSGALPFDPKCSLPDLQRAIRDEVPVRPSSRLSDRERARAIRGDLDWITLRCLEKDPTRRYPSVSALLEDLARHAANEPVEAGPPELSYRVRKFVRRNRLAIISVVLIFLALASGMIMSLAGFAEARKNEQSARAAEEQAEKLLDESEAARDEAEARLYAAEMITARDAWDGGRIKRYWNLLQGRLPADGKKDRRGWEWFYLRSLTERQEGQIALHEAESSEVIALSPDRRLLASGSESGTIVIHDLESGNQVHQIEAHEGKVFTLSWHPGGTRLASSGADGRVLIWTLNPFQAEPRVFVAQQPTKKPTVRVRYSPDGKLLATSSFDPNTQSHGVTVKRAEDGEVVSSWTDDRWIAELAWHPQSELLAITSGTDEQKASIRNALSGQLVTRLMETQYPRADGASLAWSPDGQYLAMAHQRVYVYDTVTWKPTIRELDPGLFEIRHGIAWSPDSRRFAAIHQDNSIRIWDIEQKREIRRFHGSRPRAHRLKGIIWGPDSSHLLSAQSDGRVTVWNVEREEVAIRLEFDSWIPDLAWIAQGRSLVISRHGHCRFSLETSRVEHMEPFVLGLSVAANATGDRFAAISQRGAVTVWDEKTGEVRNSFRTPSYSSKGWRRIALSPDGQLLAAWWPDDAVPVYEADSGRLRFKLHGRIARAAWSPDGRFIATASDEGELKLWDPAGRPIGAWPSGLHSIAKFAELSWRPDSRQLAIAGGSRLTVWDVGPEGLNPKLEMEFEGTLNARWHPDGTRLAITNQDGTIRIAEATTGTELLHLPGHKAAEMDVRWSPDGQRLAAFSFTGGVVEIWDASKGYEPRPADSDPPWNLKQARGWAVAMEANRELEARRARDHADSNKLQEQAAVLAREGKPEEAIDLIQRDLETYPWVASIPDAEVTIAVECGIDARSPWVRDIFLRHGKNAIEQGWGEHLLQAGAGLALGEHWAEFRDYCRAIIVAFGESTDSRQLEFEWAGKVLLLLPNPPDHEMIEAGAAMLSRGTGEMRLSSEHINQALIAYRKGNHKLAWSELASVAPPKSRAQKVHVEPMATLLRALTAYQLGMTAKARENLDEARRQVEARSATIFDKSNYWEFHFVHRILLREAESLIAQDQN